MKNPETLSAQLRKLEAAAAAACAARDAAHAELTQAAEAAAAAAKAAAEVEAQDELRAMTARIATLTEEADAAFAVFLAKFQEAQRVEVEARQLSEKRLGRPTFSGAVLPSALGDYGNFLRSLLTGAPQGLRPFASTRAVLSVRRLLASAGL